MFPDLSKLWRQVFEYFRISEEKFYRLVILLNPFMEHQKKTFWQAESSRKKFAVFHRCEFQPYSRSTREFTRKDTCCPPDFSRVTSQSAEYICLQNNHLFSPFPFLLMGEHVLTLWAIRPAISLRISAIKSCNVTEVLQLYFFIWQFVTTKFNW